MPMANTMTDHGRLMRTLIYGRDKTKKTWWAGRAAEAGFNVLHLDGDESASIFRNLSPEAQSRILTVNLNDQAKRATYARFIALFLKGDPFIYDEQDQSLLKVNTQLNPNHSHVYFDQSKFTANDVIVFDTWTSLVGSTVMEFSIDQNVDLTAIERDGDNFMLPNYQTRFLDHFLNRIKTLSAHTIVIGHEMIYEKFQGKGRERKVVGTYTQPISSTGPHGQKLGKFFENVLRFTRPSDVSFRIDAGGDDNVAGGSRLVEPIKYNWNDLTPQVLMGKLGSVGNKDIPCKGAIWMAPGVTLRDVIGGVTTTNQPAALTGAPQPSLVVEAGSEPKKVSLLSKLNKS